MLLYLLRNNTNKELIQNSNGTLKVYNDIQLAQADADIYLAHVITLDYNILLEYRIQQVVKDCIAKKITLNVSNAVIQSVFSPGGTLIGKEKQVRDYIEKLNLIKKYKDE